MKITRAACLILLIGFQGALARDLPAQVGPNESELDRHGYYQNRTGQTVHQPAKSLNGQIPEGAFAKCRDDTYSFSRHSSGTAMEGLANG